MPKRILTVLMCLFITLGATLIFIGGSTRQAMAFFGVGEEPFDELLMKIWAHNFYTDFVRTTIQGKDKEVTKGLIARDGQDVRVDTDSRAAEKTDDEMAEIMLWTGMIMLPEQKKSIMLFHIPKKFMIMRPEESEKYAPEKMSKSKERGERYVPPKVEKIKIGEEKHDNHPCDVYKIIVTWPDGKKREGKGWQAQDLEIKPWLKFEVYYPEDEPDRTEKIELYNLKIGRPARSWFSPPPAYTEIKDFMELYKGMMGDMGM